MELPQPPAGPPRRTRLAHVAHALQTHPLQVQPRRQVPQYRLRAGDDVLKPNVQLGSLLQCAPPATKGQPVGCFSVVLCSGGTTTLPSAGLLNWSRSGKARQGKAQLGGGKCRPRPAAISGSPMPFARLPAPVVCHIALGKLVLPAGRRSRTPQRWAAHKHEHTRPPCIHPSSVQAPFASAACCPRARDKSRPALALHAIPFQPPGMDRQSAAGPCPPQALTTSCGGRTPAPGAGLGVSQTLQARQAGKQRGTGWSCCCPGPSTRMHTSCGCSDKRRLVITAIAAAAGVNAAAAPPAALPSPCVARLTSHSSLQACALISRWWAPGLPAR